MLFDAHTHINNEDYTKEERAALIEEINASNLSFTMDIGFDYPSSLQAVKDAKDCPKCYAVVGVHPHDADSMSEEILEKIEELTKEDKVKAIGEIGLDFHYDNSDRSVQEYWFRRQIRLANKLKLPIAVHSRDADKLTFDILKEEGAFTEERKSWFPKRPGIDGQMVPDSRVQIHCFSGSSDLAKEYVREGATISICGPVTFKNNKKTVKVVSEIPLEFLLVETDAPYLAPEPFRGRKNKSTYVEHVAAKVAEIKGLSLEEVARVTLENGKRFFSI